MKTKLILAGLLFSGLQVFAQENDSIKNLQEVVVSDSKFALTKEKSGKIITKITSEDLLKRQGETAASILSSIAGIEVNGNHSNTSKNQEIYIRGGRSNQALILIDGIPVTDASGINLTYDLRLLPVDQIESIEIMNGASSTLYGTSAATGVINIKLKKSGNKAIGGSIYSNIGTQNLAKNNNNFDANLFNQGISLNGKYSFYEHFTSFNHTFNYGISEIIGLEKDKSEKINAIHKSTFQICKKTSLGIFVNYDYLKNNFDGAFDNASNPDLTVNNSFTEQFRFGILPRFKYNKGELQLNAGFNTIDRSYNVFNSWTSKIDFSKFKSRSLNADLSNKYELYDILSIIAGGQFQFHEMNSNTPYDNINNTVAHYYTIDPNLNFILNTKFGFNFNAGGRLNIHSVYGNHFVYNANPSFQFNKIPLKLLASYSTAYITPSLYQLYSPYGNLELKAEENANLEAGFDISFINKKINLNAVGFKREESNKIGFYTDPITFTSKYINLKNDVIKSQGVETNIKIQLIKKLKITGNYTFTENEKGYTRLIPKHKVNASLDLQATSRLFFNASYQYVDKRDDAYFDGNTFTTQKIDLNSYKLINATLRHELVKNRLTIFGTVTNILDEEYSEIYAYNTFGRNYKIGMNFLF